MLNKLGLQSIGLAVIAMSLGTIATAQTVKPKDVIQKTETNKFANKEKAILDKIKKDNPKLPVTKATYLEDVKLFELSITGVTTPTYTNEEFSFMFNNGDLIDPHKKINVTKARATLANPQEPSASVAPHAQTSPANKTSPPTFSKVSDVFTSLPFDTAIKMTYGKTGQRAIAVFSDPRCPYCKRMDLDIMMNLKGVDLDVYYFMNPLDIKGHEDAPLIASKVLCADDKVKAWKEWMLLGKIPGNDGKACVPIVDKHLDIAIKRHYDATPTIITDTGFVLPSTLSSSNMASFLADTKDFGKK